VSNLEENPFLAIKHEHNPDQKLESDAVKKAEELESRTDEDGNPEIVNDVRGPSHAVPSH
jgi:hypothetical protein